MQVTFDKQPTQVKSLVQIHLLDKSATKVVPLPSH